MVVRIARLKRRAEFLRVAAARRKRATPGLILQAAESQAANAVEGEWMNEIKERCREIDEGKVKLIPGEEGLNRLQEKYK